MKAPDPKPIDLRVAELIARVSTGIDEARAIVVDSEDPSHTGRLVRLDHADEALSELRKLADELTRARLTAEGVLGDLRATEALAIDDPIVLLDALSHDMRNANLSDLAEQVHGVATALTRRVEEDAARSVRP